MQQDATTILEIFDGIARAERAVEEQSTFTHEQAKERLSRWLSKYAHCGPEQRPPGCLQSQSS